MGRRSGATAWWKVMSRAISKIGVALMIIAFTAAAATGCLAETQKAAMGAGTPASTTAL